MEEYDICVIGAGSAGLVAASAANRSGASPAGTFTVPVRIFLAGKAGITAQQVVRIIMGAGV